MASLGQKANKVDNIGKLIEEGKSKYDACKEEGIQVKTYNQYKKELQEHLALYDEIKALQKHNEKLKIDVQNLQNIVDCQRNKSKIAEDYDEMRKKVERYERYILKHLIGES